MELSEASKKKHAGPHTSVILPDLRPGKGGPKWRTASGNICPTAPNGPPTSVSTKWAPLNLGRTLALWSGCIFVTQRGPNSGQLRALRLPACHSDTLGQWRAHKAAHRAQSQSQMGEMFPFGRSVECVISVSRQTLLLPTNCITALGAGPKTIDDPVERETGASGKLTLALSGWQPQDTPNGGQWSRAAGP